MKKNLLYLVTAFLMFCSTDIIAQSVQNAMNEHFEQLLEKGSVVSQDIQWEITSDHVSRTSGIHHIYFRQVIDGIQIYGTDSSIHLTSDGKMITSNNRFVGNISNRSVVSSASLTAQQAVEAAASQLGYSISESLTTLERKPNASQETLLSKSGISLSNIPAKLVYQVLNDGSLGLAWDISIEEIARENWWNVRLDANSGQIVDQINWMLSCSFEHDHSEHEKPLDYHANLFDIPNYKNNELEDAVCVECYEVFPLPLESPYYGQREEEINPANNIASPFGWHDTNGAAGAEFTDTRGNNVDARDDGDNPGYRPDGGTDLDFSDFPFDQVYTNSNQYEDAAITQLFYSNNILHDIMYQYGFDETSGNFQQNNYGNGGAGNDPVNAFSQIAQNCNATFGTPPDGSRPSMNMFVCNDKDGNFDTLVVFHEYGHGISNRLTGGPAASGCLGNTEQMGEGWSDYIGAVLTIQPGDVATDARGVGTYLFGQGINGGGIRSFPYSTDLATNPQTYDDIKTESIPHGVGSVWATMLWEMTWELIDEYGYDSDPYNFTGDVNQDAGNVMALALVTEGMKLQPCSPGFVDGRDAIFAADQALYGGANECFLWDAFAKRGLGINADQGSSNDRSDGTESFETPSAGATFVAPQDVCATEAPLTGLGGGSPQGGVYSGPGVTDDGNGITYTFDPAAAGEGVHTITYNLPASNCAPASSDSDTIEVLAVGPAPTVTGADGYCPGDSVTLVATLNDPNNIINWYDAPTGGNIVFTGETYNFTPSGNEDVYAGEVPDEILSQLKITEAALQVPDQFEIQNVGVAADYSGYTVAVSDEPYANINAVNPVTKTLGSMGSDEAIAWTDGGGPNDWGDNIFWDASDPGWILVIDADGNVVDSLFWNTTAGEIATFNVTINGFNITAADLDWTGNGANFTQVCSGTSYRRINETDNAANWANSCETSDFGAPNADLGFGFVGCLGERTEVILTDGIAPQIVCPDEQFELVDAGGFFTIPDYTSQTTATDNCDSSVTIEQDLAAGTEVGEGTYTITMDAEDSSGNTQVCTFNLVVSSVLSTPENELSLGLVMFPNPTNGIFTVQNNSNQVITNIEVIDIAGRIVTTLSNSNALDTIEIDLRAPSSGTYFVRVKTKKGTVVKRIVKR
ncbi:M36 family metallopeptidase [Patiriisocius hiemis]|uniref:M36 family metallopeptidase n=1 Tax=Patiriisocius hiemis TaxID=3075604 RepID=A0ABU2YA83_9FLAO|nr:M36 family metallopeptidase [Constantimarinum sp. W242]MDT0555096.1 M36 family metallopeptidase [Constantimarinum sp. W242]